MGAETRAKGAIVEGKAGKVMKSMVAEINEDVGQEAYDAIRQRLNRVLKNPTGYYENHVQVDNTTQGAVVNDGGVVYGGWLETGGPGFSGYHTFAQVFKEINQQAAKTADQVIKSQIGKLG